MNITRAFAGVAGVVVITALAGWALLEHQARLRMAQANQTARQALLEWDQVVAENLRLSNLVASPKTEMSGSTNGASVSPATDQRRVEEQQKQAEVARLRQEVAELEAQVRQIEAVRVDTRQVRAARQNMLGHVGAAAASVAQDLEIVSADYGTERTNMDVAEELTDRIRPDGLKAVASNNIKGDPEFGQVKRLRIVYRLGGATMTNEFREGDLVVIPPTGGEAQ